MGANVLDTASVTYVQYTLPNQVVQEYNIDPNIKKINKNKMFFKEDAKKCVLRCKS